MTWAMHNREVRFDHGGNVAHLTQPEHTEPFALAPLTHHHHRKARPRRN